MILGVEGEKKFIATQYNTGEEFEPNLDQVIDNIQDEPSVFAKLLISIVKPTQLVATKSSQHVQPIVDYVQMENPQLFKFQPILIFGHSTKT